MWPKFDACGPPLTCDQNLMPVVPPYHVTKISCLWSPLTMWPKFHAYGPPLPCDQNLMPVVPPYHVTKISCLWSPLTIWPKFHAYGPPLPCDQNLMPVVPPYHVTKIWCLWSRILQAVFHCSRFAHARDTTDFNLVKNQPRRHATKVKCSSTSKRVRAHKSRQKTLRLDTYSKS